MAVTALAGPASNVLLTILAMLICKCIYLYAPYTPVWNGIFEFLLYMVAPLSLGLGLFNLIPIPPLDGSKVLGALLSDRAYFTLMRYERYGMLLLLAIAVFGIGDGFIGALISGAYAMLFNLFF